MSGLHSDSHIPYSCSVQVPLTTKSSVSMGQPIRSIAAMNGSLVLGSSPAITGSTKYGPNLCSKNETNDALQHPQNMVTTFSHTVVKTLNP